MSIIIFDYDDTLFPTTYFQHHQHLSCKDFTRLNNIIEKLINTLESRGFHIFLVSNGNSNWIKESVKFIPALYDKLLSNSIQGISCRDIYENSPIKYDDWKRLVFVNIFSTPPYSFLDIAIGVGDTVNDKECFEDACKYTKKKHQFIKFDPAMNIDTLSATLNEFIKYIHQHFKKINM